MRIVSGIRPTGSITLGNYIGAIKQFIELQNTLSTGDEFFIFVADLHAITTHSDNPKALKKYTEELINTYLALGLDPAKCTLFVQSSIKEIPLLNYILGCVTNVGELERMTQYKDKINQNDSNIRATLLTYPILQAADILIFDATVVPIGADQKQHLELTRDIAMRFNSLYGETFVVPEVRITKDGAKIKSFTDPTKKMSKSDVSLKSYILLQDDINQAKNKIKSAVTDSVGVINYDEENQPGLSNLITIYAALTNQTIECIVKQYHGKTYATFKNDLANIVGDFLQMFQSNYQKIMSSKISKDIIKEATQKVSVITNKKINLVCKKMGLSEIK